MDAEEILMFYREHKRLPTTKEFLGWVEAKKNFKPEKGWAQAMIEEEEE